MKPIAVGSRIIVRPDPENESSTLVIPDAVKKFANRGVIVAAGAGRRHIDGKLYPLEVKVGQKVMFSLLRTFPFVVGNDRLMAMDAEDVLCILDEDNPAAN